MYKRKGEKKTLKFTHTHTRAHVHARTLTRGYQVTRRQVKRKVSKNKVKIINIIKQKFQKLETKKLQIGRLARQDIFKVEIFKINQDSNTNVKRNVVALINYENISIRYTQVHILSKFRNGRLRYQ